MTVGISGERMRRDPVLLFIVGWTALADLMFFLLDGHVDAQVRIFWLAQLPLDALLGSVAWRVSRLAAGAVRRFWRVLTLVGTVFLVGDTSQAVLSFTGPGRWSTSGGVVQSTCLTVGLGAIVVAMLAHPQAGRSGRDRLAFLLDSATVLVGGAVVAWCFAVSPDRTSQVDLLRTLAGVAVAITAGFAAVKLVLSGNAPMRRAAAIPMIASAIFITLGFFLVPSNGDRALPPLMYVIALTPSLLITLGPRIQEVIAGFASSPFGERRRKPYSLLPYGSIAIAFGALVVVMPSGVTVRLWGVVVGLGLICALVAGRQLVAFHALQEVEARLRHQATHDGLTGLANRTFFADEVAAALAAGSGPSVLLIDLDGFKAVNDTMGHAGGDALLVAVGDMLTLSLRTGDLAARLGGDEFAVLLRSGSAPEEVAERILAAMAVPVDIFGEPVRARASIGAASASPGDDVNGLLRRADLAMYAAKSAGKGRFSLT